MVTKLQLQFDFFKMCLHPCLHMSTVMMMHAMTLCSIARGPPAGMIEHASAQCT